MIVRILGEGQYEVPETELPALEQLDAALNKAIESDDEASFSRLLAELVATVRRGAQLTAETIVPSQLTVPPEGATLGEVRQLLAEEPESAETVTEGA